MIMLMRSIWRYAASILALSLGLAATTEAAVPQACVTALMLSTLTTGIVDGFILPRTNAITALTASAGFTAFFVSIAASLMGWELTRYDMPLMVALYTILTTLAASIQRKLAKKGRSNACRSQR